MFHKTYTVTSYHNEQTMTSVEIGEDSSVKVDIPNSVDSVITYAHNGVKLSFVDGRDFLSFVKDMDEIADILVAQKGVDLK